LFWYLKQIGIKFSITAIPFCVIASYINLLYLHKIAKMLIIPKKARGPDWNPSRARSGLRTGLGLHETTWDYMGLLVYMKLPVCYIIVLWRCWALWNIYYV